MNEALCQCGECSIPPNPRLEEDHITGEDLLCDGCREQGHRVKAEVSA